MKFYLSKLIRFLMSGYTDNIPKNMTMLALVCITDASIYLIAGLMLASVGNVRATSILIIAMFAAASASFFCRRLFVPPLQSAADRALIRKKSEISDESNALGVRFLSMQISSRSSASLRSITAAIGIIISEVIILILNPLTGLISAAVICLYLYISSRRSESIRKAADKLFGLKHSEAISDDDETMTDDDNEIYLRNELTEAEAETKSLMHIVSIIGWTVCCVVPIILGQTLQQCVTAAVMQLYFVFQTFILADTFSDISIVTYCIDKLDNGDQL